ncbi:MAG TPA: hypothetical protein VFN37_01445 [Candidatus Baltobacteraceae bacterium]|nr:hypothetical protein [Candidatus Baltobacteraceae bacterium]
MLSLVVTGFPKHAPYLAKLLRERAGAHAVYYSDTRTDVLRAAGHALHADGCIALGGPQTKELVRKICNARKRPVILLWSGSDVEAVRGRPEHLERLRLQNVIHWACTPHLAEQLAPLGIDARYVPVTTPTVPARLAPIPAAFGVLAYLPQHGSAFYAQEQLWALARTLNEVEFVVAGPKPADGYAPPNVHYAGRVADRARHIDESSAVLRLTEHDGLDTTIIDALARGRHAIWTCSFPGVVRASSVDEMARAIQALRIAHEHGRLGWNELGLQYVLSEHDPDAVCRGITAAFREAIELTRSRAGDTGSIRLAISGQRTFSTRVADNSQNASAGISATLLSTRSTSETAVSALSLLASDAWYGIGEPSGPPAFEFIASVTRKRRIVHWLGDELEGLGQNGALLRRLRTPRFVHLAQSDDVRLRLRELGLHARVVPLAAVSPVAAVPPFPRTFTLMLYLPRDGPQFYGRYQYERLMQALLPERVEYFIVGGGHIEVPDGAIAERIEWSYDLSRIYERSTTLVRFTPPDYTSSMVIEALLHGRHVLSAGEFPFVTSVRTFADMECEVRSLLQRHRAGTLVPQVDAARAMQAHYSPDRCLSLLAEACGWTPAALPRTAIVPHT